MGGTCVLAPRLTLDLCAVRPPVSGTAGELTTLVFRCFGAQAMLCGTLLCAARLSRRAFLAWAAAILPFLAFDYYFCFVEKQVTPLGAAGDLAGNVAFLVASLYGAAQRGYGEDGAAAEAARLKGAKRQ